MKWGGDGEVESIGVCIHTNPRELWLSIKIYFPPPKQGEIALNHY